MVILNNDNNPISKLESSLYTLWSLFILCDQNYQSLFKYRQLFEQDFEFKHDDEIHIDTINEALIYQILLKTCSFIDEWDEIFGVQTEQDYKESIFLIKRICKPARSFLKKWKGLREFRNQVVAHNHRDANGNNVYLSRKVFDSPNSINEFGLIIYSIEKMVRVTAALLPNETTKIFTPSFSNIGGDYSGMNFMEIDEIVAEIEKIDAEVRNGLYGHFNDTVDVPSYYRELLLGVQ
jgi:hypothetical protein